jgi:hypothetical protein
MSPRAAVTEGPGATPSAASVPVVPFDQASHRGMRNGPQWTVTPGASQQTLGPQGIPATSGYLRSIIIEVVGAGGAGAATGAGDYPWNVIKRVMLEDTNGAPLVNLSGFNLLLANIYGGYAGSPDPRNDPDYSNSATNPAFQLRVPIEIAPNGLGSLANMSSAAQYQLTIDIDTTANIWTSAPATTIPTLTVKTFTDHWTLPAPQDMLGRAQQQQPPFNGTAQYWTQSQNNAVSTGGNETEVDRVGNLIRTLIFVGRVSGVRSEVPIPDPFSIDWDARLLRSSVSLRSQRKIIREMVEQLSARDTGVYAFPFSYGEGRHVGELGINSWLPTVTATRLALVGSSSGAGTIDVVVNDVSVAEVNPAARAVETSATGYHPPVAPTVMAAQ